MAIGGWVTFSAYGLGVALPIKKGYECTRKHTKTRTRKHTQHGDKLRHGYCAQTHEKRFSLYCVDAGTRSSMIFSTQSCLRVADFRERLEHLSKYCVRNSHLKTK